MSGKTEPIPPRDVIAQLQDVLRCLERSLLLLEPVQPAYQAQYDQLRRLRDQLEETFTQEQAERLRQGALDFTGEVAELKKVINDLEGATQRATKAKEVVGYVTMAVDVATRVVGTILPLLGLGI